LSFGATVPLFGFTVYALGAVVLTLNDSRFFEGLMSFRSTETGSVNDPEADNVSTTKDRFTPCTVTGTNYLVSSYNYFLTTSLKK